MRRDRGLRQTFRTILLSDKYGSIPTPTYDYYFKQRSLSILLECSFLLSLKIMSDLLSPKQIVSLKAPTFFLFSNRMEFSYVLREYANVLRFCSYLNIIKKVIQSAYFDIAN